MARLEGCFRVGDHRQHKEEAPAVCSAKGHYTNVVPPARLRDVLPYTSERIWSGLGCLIKRALWLDTCTCVRTRKSRRTISMPANGISVTGKASSVSRFSGCQICLGPFNKPWRLTNVSTVKRNGPLQCRNYRMRWPSAAADSRHR